MMRSGYVVSTVFGIFGFLSFGFAGVYSCGVYSADPPFNCGWLFIIMALIGSLAGLVVGGVVFLLVKVMVHFLRMLIEKLVPRLPGSKNSPDV